MKNTKQNPKFCSRTLQTIERAAQEDERNN